MPFEYKINLSEKLISLKAFGCFNDKDLEQIYVSIKKDPDYLPGLSFIGDFSSIEKVGVTAGAVHDCASATPIAQGAKRALIVKKEIAYGYARMYQILIETGADQLKIFDEVEAALAWLEEDSPDIKVA